MGLPATSASSHEEASSPCFGSRSRRVDRAIGEDFDDRVEVETHVLRRVPAVAAKAGQHFIHAVGGRGKADLVEEDAGEIIPGEEFAKPPNRLLARRRIVRAHEAERLLHFASFLGPASPAAAAFASPVHDEVRIRPCLRCRKGRRTTGSRRRPAGGTAELPEDFRRFSKADNEEIEVDHLLHAAHGFHHAERIERVAKGMGRRELRADFPGTDHEF